MSRIGKAPITIPQGVQLQVEGEKIRVKGSLGELLSPLPDGITMEQQDGVVTLLRRDDSRKMRERHGMSRAILNNCILGVSKGWDRRLELAGVGYRAQLKGEALVFALGYSHEVNYKLPEGINATVTDQTRIEIKGIDRQKVGQVAAEIRSLRPPEPYKGKGIKYDNEIIRRKAGKAGKAGKK